MSCGLYFHLTFIEKTFPKRIKRIRLTHDFDMSLNWHLSDVKQPDHAILSCLFEPAMESPLTLQVQKILMCDPLAPLVWVTPN